MRRLMDYLSKTEFGIYWYCVFKDLRKDLHKTLEKKSIFVWVGLVVQIIAALNEREKLMTFAFKVILVILKFLT